MKKSELLMVVCAGFTAGLVGCATRQPAPKNDYTFNPTTYTYSYTPPRHHFFSRDDGYSFCNDPYNHDQMVPTLYLDPYFPPAQIPFNGP